MADPKDQETNNQQTDREDEQPRNAAHARQPAGNTPEHAARPVAPAPAPPAAPASANDVTLTIDGHTLTVPKGTLVVEAAKKVGIEIPVFCYHHKLDTVGACRMCLVEITPGPPGKAAAACITPVGEGMNVRVTSPLAVKARADVLEFELTNHPLDCPVCDKGGECPLQDFTFRHGKPVSQQIEPRLHFAKPLPISQNIALDRERCVLCYRCTRYYDEIAWEQELTSTQRGVHTYIATQFDQPLQSIFSGNIIDLCPVGALTSRVWRFQSRPWDMHHEPSVCSKCAVGCNVNLWERRGQLMRVTSRENDDIDDGWICDRGRFDYTHVNDENRLKQPLLNGEPATWERALRTLAEGIRGKGSRLGISIPQDVTNEEAHLLSRLLGGPLKGARVVMERRTTLGKPPADQLLINELDKLKVIVVVASDVKDDAPIVNLRIKKAVKHGAQLVVVHPERLDLDRHSKTVHVDYQAGGAAAAVRSLQGHDLLRAGPVGIIFGDGRGAEDMAELATAIAELAAATGARLMPLYRATNERGALATGILTDGSLDGIEALFCWGLPPAGGIPESVRFVAVWDSLLRAEHGNPEVTLPELTFAEDEGSYTNLEGRVQYLKPALSAHRLRQGWEVLGELAALLGEDFDHAGILQVQREAAAAHPQLAALGTPPHTDPPAPPVLLGAARP